MSKIAKKRKKSFVPNGRVIKYPKKCAPGASRGAPRGAPGAPGSGPSAWVGPGQGSARRAHARHRYADGRVDCVHQGHSPSAPQAQGATGVPSLGYEGTTLVTSPSTARGFATTWPTLRCVTRCVPPPLRGSPRASSRAASLARPPRDFVPGGPEPRSVAAATCSSSPGRSVAGPLNAPPPRWGVAICV